MKALVEYFAEQVETKYTEIVSVGYQLIKTRERECL
jgi:hypothetical protein